MYFWNYRLSKSWLDHSLKGAVSEHPSTVNMLKGPKLLRNLHESTFIIFSNYFQEKACAKYLSYGKLRPYGCLLTYWLTITCIVFLILRICRSLFKCNFVKNEKLFLNFLLHLWKEKRILNILKEKKTVFLKLMFEANVFLKLQTVKDLVRPLSNNRRFRTCFDSQHVKGFQTLVKSGWEHFYHIFQPFERKIFRKYLAYWNLKP